MTAFVGVLPLSRFRALPTSRPHLHLRRVQTALAPPPIPPRQPLSSRPTSPSPRQSPSAPPKSSPALLPSPPAPPPTFTSYVVPRLLALLVSVLWSSNFACVRLLDRGVLPTADAAFARFLVSALFLSPSLFSSPPSPSLIGHGALCGLWISLGYVTQAIALQTTGAGKAAFICSLSVVFVPFVLSVFPQLAVHHFTESSHDTDGGKGRPSWAAALLAVAGVGVMELGGGGGAGGGGAQPGDLWALLMMCGFGMGFVENERALERFPASALQLTALQLAVVAAVTGGWAVADASLSAGGSAIVMPDFTMLLGSSCDWTLLAAIAYTGIVTTAGTIWLENLALKKVSASEMAVILSTEPLFATGIAAVFLGEAVGVEAAFGGALILGAVAVSQVVNAGGGGFYEAVKSVGKRFGRGEGKELCCVED